MRKLLNKKALSAFLAIVMTFATMAGMFTFSASAATTVTDWTASTVYLNNADDVQYFFNNLILDDDGYEGQTFLLTADVDMSGKTITARNGNSHKAFSGIFDGQGYTISNLSVSVGAGTGGLFGGKGATTPEIRNVSFVNATYTGNHQAGFFYGILSTNITIESVYIDFVNAKFVGSSNAVGGMIGWYKTDGTTATIKNCVVTGNFEDNKAGGFIGELSTATVNFENCAFYGTIPVDSSGGFVWSNGTTATLKNCISLGTITGNRSFAVTGTCKSEGTVIAATGTSTGSADREIANLVKYDKSAMTGTAAQAILTDKEMTGWVATTTGYPMPKALVKTSTPTPDADALTNYVGYQTTKVADGTFGLRLVGNLDADATLADYDSVGFKVVAFFDDNAVAQECDITTVYETITASYDGTKSYSEAGKFVFVQECANLPATLGDITFEVTTYATAAGGETVTLGATYRFVVDVSEIPSAS